MGHVWKSQKELKEEEKQRQPLMSAMPDCFSLLRENTCLSKSIWIDSQKEIEVGEVNQCCISFLFKVFPFKLVNPEEHGHWDLLKGWTTQSSNVMCDEPNTRVRFWASPECPVTLGNTLHLSGSIPLRKKDQVPRRERLHYDSPIFIRRTVMMHESSFQIIPRGACQNAWIIIKATQVRDFWSRWQSR